MKLMLLHCEKMVKSCIETNSRRLNFLLFKIHYLRTFARMIKMLDLLTADIRLI